jgi:hypothetical protein
VIAAITSKQWKNLLEGVKSKLGEGNISRLSIWRRYTCLTTTGSKLKLALGSWPCEDERWLFPYVEVTSKTVFRGEIRLGENARFMLATSVKWKDVAGVNQSFLSQYKPVCTNQDFARSLLSERAQAVIEELAKIRPRGITVLVKKRSIVAYKVCPILEVGQLTLFVKAGMELADTLL